MSTSFFLLLTLSIVGIIAALSLAALVSNNSRLVNAAPSMLTSLGIFGTFLGITIGLTSFNPDDIRASLPHLFAGIQLAFWTSVAGILGAILVKFRILMLGGEAPGSPRSAMQDMISSLRSMERSLIDENRPALLNSLRELQQESNQQTETLTASLDALGGKLDDLNKGSDEVLLAIQKGSQSQSEASSRQLGDVVRQVGQGQAEVLDELRSGRQDTNAHLAAMQRTMEDVHGALTTGETTAMLERLDALRAGSDALINTLGQSLAGNRDALASQIATAVADLRDALVGPKGAGRELGKQIQQGQADLIASQARLSEDLSKALGKQLTAVTGQLADSSREAAEQMLGVARAIEDLQRALGGDSAAMLAKLDTLREGSAYLADKIGKSMDGSRDALAAQIAAAVSGLRDALSGSDETTRDLGQLIQQGQAELASSVAGSLDGLRKALGQDLAALNAGLGQSGSQSSEQLLAVAEAIETLRTAMGSDSSALLDKLDAIRDGSKSLGDKLGKALLVNRDALTSQIAAAVTDLRDALVGPDGAASGMGKLIQQGQVELATSLARATESLRKALGGEVTSLTSQLTESGREANEQMRGVVNAIKNLEKALGSDSTTLLTKLDAMRDGSAVLSDRIGEEMQASRDAMAARITEAVTDLRNALVGPDGAATELGKQIQKGQVDLAGSLSRATEGLGKTIGSETKKLNELLTASSREAAAQVLGMAQAIDSLRQSLGGDSAALQATLDALREGSTTLGEQFGQAMTANRDAMSRQMADSLNQLRDALTGPDGAATGLANQLHVGLAELTAALAEASEGMKAAFGQDAEAVYERIDALNESLRDLASGVAGAFGDATGGLSGNLDKMGVKLLDAIDDLRLAVVGPDGAQSGIVDELRSAQSETGKALGAIKSAVEENTQRQIDYSPKSLMAVLEEMIRQFNTQFAGQFWKKFDDFNRSVGELLEWMETYRTQLGDMVEQQGRSARNMDIATRRFDDVASRSEIFIDVFKNLSALLGGLDSQRVQMESHLKRFAHIADATSSSLENIEHKIVAGNVEMNEHIRDISERIEEQVIRVDQALSDEMSKAMTTFGQQLAALSEKFVEDYAPLTDRLRDVVSLARAV